MQWRALIIATSALIVSAGMAETVLGITTGDTTRGDRRMTDDPIAARSRYLHVKAAEIESRIVDAIKADDPPALMALGGEIHELLRKRDVGTGCDVALMDMEAVAGVLGNPGTTRSIKRDWARSDGEALAERIETFLASCEDDAGVPRSTRRLTAAVITSYR